MITKEQKWQIAFYPGVFEDIASMQDELRGKFEAYFQVMQEVGGDLGMPKTRPMGDGLFELRVKAKQGIGRGLFCYQKGRRIIVLCVFVKKQQETPKRFLDLARKRMKEIENG